MRELKLVTALTGAAITVVLVIIYSGAIDVGATSPHGTLANWLLTTTMRQSVQRHARSVELPAGVDDGDMWLAGHDASRNGHGEKDAAIVDRDATKTEGHHGGHEDHEH